MKEKIRKIQIVFGLMVAVGLLFSFISCTRGENRGYIDESQRAPDFTLPSIDGGALSLSDFKGKIILLDFWATWCPPCLKEIPGFIELYNEYKNKDFVIIGVSLDQGDIGQVKDFCERMKINYPIVIGGHKITQKYGGIRGIPTTFIIDPNGIIVNKFVGYRSPEVFQTQIEKLLSE